MDDCKTAADNTRTAVILQAQYQGRELPVADRDVDGRLPAHALWMLNEISSGRVEGNKAQRWLGYAQGILVANEMVELAEVKDANRQASEAGA